LSIILILFILSTEAIENASGFKEKNRDKDKNKDRSRNKDKEKNKHQEKESMEVEDKEFISYEDFLKTPGLDLAGENKPVKNFIDENG